MPTDELDKAYDNCFSTGSGRMVLEDLFWNYFERPQFDDTTSNTMAKLAFLEGQRSVVLDIRAALRRSKYPDLEEQRQDSTEPMLDDEDILWER